MTRTRILFMVAGAIDLMAALIVLGLNNENPLERWRPYREKLESLQSLTATIIALPKSKSGHTFSWQVKLKKASSLMETDLVDGKPVAIKIQQGTIFEPYTVSPRGWIREVADSAIAPQFTDAINIFEPFVTSYFPPTSPARVSRHTIFSGYDVDAFAFTRDVSIARRRSETNTPTREDSRTEEITIYYNVSTKLPVGYTVRKLASNSISKFLIKDLRVNPAISDTDFTKLLLVH